MYTTPSTNVHAHVHVAARRSEDGSQEYLCKWRGLPYSECTWEDGQLIGCWYQDTIDAYHERSATDTIPNKNAKVSVQYTLQCTGTHIVERVNAESGRSTN